jgi:hypothetical protein
VATLTLHQNLIIHGLGAHFDALDRVGGQNRDASVCDRVRAGGKPYAFDMAPFNKALSFAQKKTSIRLRQTQEIPTVKGNLH